MKTNSLLYLTLRNKVLVSSCAFLLSVSCSKEMSAVAPQLRTVSLFMEQTPSNYTQKDSTWAIELGLKFRTTVAGTIDGIRFYKTSGNTGLHTGQLYSGDGTLLSSAVFTNETDTGWQTVMFTNPVPISSNKTYIAAYHSSWGTYVSTDLGFYKAFTNAPLTALADSTDGPNGVYKYTSSPQFPDTGYQSTNYWVDVILTYPTGE